MHACTKAFAALFVAFTIWFVYKKFIVQLIQRNRLIKQGVIFLDRPFEEAWLLKLASRQNPTDPVLNAIATKIAKDRG